MRMTYKGKLLAGVVVPAIVGTGLLLGGFETLVDSARADTTRNAGTTLLPVARKLPVLTQLAACKPCAAKKPACGACNPCAAKKRGCGPSNPCAAKGACNPCNPCAAGGTNWSSECMIPRLRTAAACNPCAAKKRGCGPCNPCAAKKSACGPANPCAAKKSACGPANPCAAKKSPCGPANPCNPCGAAPAIELTAAEANAAYRCLFPAMKGGYAKAGLAIAAGYEKWANVSTQPYTSATHGNRFVSNYANATGAASYRKFEQVGKMPVGSVLAKDSFLVSPDGKTGAGPLFLMEKMAAGWNKESGDWRYSMVMPGGSVMGITRGANGAAMKFCAECHMGVAEQQDSLFFLPAEFRKK